MAIAKDKFAKVADKLLNDTFAAAQGEATFKNSGGYDPTTGTTTPGPELSIPVTMANYKQSQIDGQRIKKGDRKMIVEEAVLGSFEISVDQTELTYTGPKDTDSAVALTIVGPITEYAMQSVKIFQVRDR